MTKELDVVEFQLNWQYDKGIRIGEWDILHLKEILGGEEQIQYIREKESLLGRAASKLQFTVLLKIQIRFQAKFQEKYQYEYKTEEQNLILNDIKCYQIQQNQLKFYQSFQMLIKTFRIQQQKLTETLILWFG